MKGTFKIGNKEYDVSVPYIGDAERLDGQTCTLFYYRRRRFYGSADCFVKVGDNVYTAGRHGLDLIGQYGANDIQRRAWCRAAGVPWKAFQTAMKAHRAKRAAIDKSDRLAQVRRSAQHLGYKLVRA